MQVTIKELNIIGIGLRSIGGLPLVGALKFKIARNLKAAEDILEDAMLSLIHISEPTRPLF